MDEDLSSWTPISINFANSSASGRSGVHSALASMPEAVPATQYADIKS
jgi:hypothetical protein